MGVGIFSSRWLPRVEDGPEWGMAEYREPVYIGLARIKVKERKSTHAATMDADRWLIVMDSPVPLGLDYVRKEAA